MTNARHPLFFKTLFALGLLIILLVALELALRLLPTSFVRVAEFRPWPDPNPITSRTAVFPPNYDGTLQNMDYRISVRSNSLGFREREFDIDAVAAGRPYVFVGDSFILGKGVSVEERVSDLFARMIAGTPYDAPVLNLAFAAINTYQYLDILTAYVPRLKPRLVVIGAYLGNDLYLDAHGEGVVDPSALRMFLRTSPLLNVAESALWALPGFHDLYNPAVLDDTRIPIYDPAGDTFEATFRAYDQIAALARQHDAKIVVALLPDHLQVMSPELLSDVDAGRPQRLLGAYLDSIGLPYIDLLPPILRTPDPLALYYPLDRHWTAAGHKLAAETLVKWLAEPPATAAN